MNAHDVAFLTKLSKIPKITAYPSILKCARGNIDVTLDKDVISNEKTPYPLVRGRNIQSLDTITEFITSKTVEEKKINITNKKLVCQQICNMGSQNRLTFTLLDANFVISNSCNYILVNDDKYLATVKHILNSRVLNRYFTIFSGNNHVSINEIYNLPFPNMFDNRLNLLEDMTPEELDSKIYELYGLDNTFATNYFGGTSGGTSNKRIVIYNHISQKLSDMEQTMATYIKPGGNWKDIPTSLTTSERLNNIRKTGGRTTLYGRLEYNKPGFTITTQFSRLPNSSNLHPCKNRMITIREAGLIQSFPIDFKFNDNKSVAITQIGNAVPPLLARFLANLIKNDVTNKNTLDLFSGVGGMSIGFSQEGFNVVLSNELDEKLANEKENKKYHKNTVYVCGDICDSKIKSTIKEKLADTKIGVIIGGPPCQGFSLAGKRDSDDKRNKLYLDYFQMIETYNPECFVMENVKGILSMKNEANQLVIEEIKGIATRLGYKVSVFKLNACDFVVPQKRERVFVIGHKTKLYEAPNAVIRKEKYVTIKDAIGFLEPFDENTTVDVPATAINNPYLNYLSDITSLEELYKSYS
jgi:DNA (cytosine-5)-methyltransferase 1